jgi:hypothetical protein
MSIQYFIRVTKITLGTTDIEHIKSVSWVDSDPYVICPIPCGDNIQWLLKQPLVSGKITTIDIDGLYDALEDEGAINFTTGVRKKITASITVKKTDGSTATYTFTDFRVGTVGIGELTEDGKTEVPYILTFTAKCVVKT